MNEASRAVAIAMLLIIWALVGVGLVLDSVLR
jgi:hypothetical protein